MAPGERGHLFLVANAPSRDEELVAAFLRGESTASAAIWERYYPTVRRIVFRSLGPVADADDAIQEVFLRLYRKLPGLRDPSSLRAFVLAITVRVVKGEQRLRWVKRWLGLFSDGEVPDSQSQSADVDAREAVARFYGILERLGAQHRTAFVLRYVEGLELMEVAEALGVSRATIKRWLPRIAQRVFAQVRGDPALAAYLVQGSLVVRHDD